MFRLCICDDKEADIKELQTLANLFSQEHPEIPIQIQVFQSPNDLMEHIGAFGGFDLYLLDVIMPDLDGIELAKRIRERGEVAEIIFLTVSREFAVEAFSVKASNYLVKPIEKEAFDREVLSCVENMAQENNPSLLLKTKQGVRKISLRELVLVESFDHRRVCTLVDGTTCETTMTLGSLYEQLKKYTFFYKPHRSYIIHLDYVNGLAASQLVLSNGKKIPVSRGSYGELKKVLLDYTIQKV